MYFNVQYIGRVIFFLFPVFPALQAKLEFKTKHIRCWKNLHISFLGGSHSCVSPETEETVVLPNSFFASLQPLKKNQTRRARRRGMTTPGEPAATLLCDSFHLFYCGFDSHVISRPLIRVCVWIPSFWYELQILTCRREDQPRRIRSFFPNTRATRREWSRRSSQVTRTWQPCGF